MSRFETRMKPPVTPFWRGIPLLNRKGPLLLNRIGRNRTCPCGSGKKFKTCCQRTSDPIQPPSAKRIDT